LQQHCPETCIDIVTCDAEVTSSKDLVLCNRIVLSWLAFCHKSKTKHGLLKTFCNDSSLLPHIKGCVQLVFRYVKIVTPTFSSHETYEVYLVGTHWEPIIDMSTLISCHQNDKQIFLSG
jgi:hypothetical protein